MSITDELREWTANFFHMAPTASVDEDRDGWVELPRDADGEYINVGDMLNGYGKTIEVVELRYGCSGWVIISRDGNAYADNYAFTHHRHDTWERIIEDALGSRWSAPDELSSDFIALVARCKALAGEPTP